MASWTFPVGKPGPDGLALATVTAKLTETSDEEMLTAERAIEVVVASAATVSVRPADVLDTKSPSAGL